MATKFNDTLRDLFDETLDTLKIAPRSDALTPQYAADLAQRLDTLKAEAAEADQKSGRSLWVWGSVLTLAGLAGLVAAVTGFTKLVPDELLFGTFVVSMVAFGVYAAAFDESNRKKAEKRLKKLHKKMIKRYEKQISGKVILENPVEEPVIAGVAARLAKRLGLPVGLVRIILLALIPITGGLMLPAYGLLAFILPNDKDGK